MSDTARIDPTAMGLLFIGFILFVVGLFGIDANNMTGLFTYAADYDYMIGQAVFPVAAVIALALVFVGYYAYKAGSLFGATVFGWVAISLLLVSSLNGMPLIIFGAAITGWFVYIIAFIFYLVFAIWAFLAGTPKILVGILAVTGLVFLFLALFLNGIVNGNGPDDFQTYGLLLGVFGLIGFVLATYLGIALTGAIKLPVI